MGNDLQSIIWYSNHTIKQGTRAIDFWKIFINLPPTKSHLTVAGQIGIINIERASFLNG